MSDDIALFLELFALMSIHQLTRFLSYSIEVDCFMVFLWIVVSRGCGGSCLLFKDSRFLCKVCGVLCMGSCLLDRRPGLLYRNLPGLI